MGKILKRARRILHGIRSLPEEGKKLIAGVGVVIFGILIFSLWSFTTASRLARLDLQQPTVQSQSDDAAAITDNSALTPISGLGESLRSFQILLGPAASDATGGLENSLKNLGSVAVGAWQWVYDAVERLPLHE